MIRSGRQYSGLDDFFDTKDRDHLLSNELIRQRIEELDSLYVDWVFHFWNFSKDSTDQNRLQKYCKDVIDTLNESYKCYILGSFNSSIIMSSIAAERLTNCVLILRRNELQNLFEMVRDTKTREPITRPQNQWYKFKTLSGQDYYAYRRNRFLPVVQLEGVYYYFILPSLSGGLETISKLGCPASELLETNESFYRCIFVARRDKMAHGAIEEAELGEQIRYLNANRKVDPEIWLFHKEAAFDQYRKASLFARETFEWFTSEYGTI